MASNTTVAIPMEVKSRLDQIHEETARDADSAPFWFTVDRAIEALADKQGVDLDD
jgi:predicted transcriptional regulator